MYVCINQVLFAVANILSHYDLFCYIQPLLLPGRKFTEGKGGNFVQYTRRPRFFLRDETRFVHEQDPQLRIYYSQRIVEVTQI